MADLQISYVNPDGLTPYINNARTHSKKHIRQIVESIKRFGWTNPILVDSDGGVIAGHGRLLAARELGMEEVPVLPVTSLTEAEKRAYIIADNKLAENAGWDRDMLAVELQALLDLDLDLDITMTGFEMAEIDILIADANVDPEEPEEVPDIDRDRPPVTQRGDLWEIGNHRVLCGDATSTEDVEHLLGGGRAQMVFTDPPYNVPVDGHVCGLGKVKHREFAMASGEMTREQFTGFLGKVFANLTRYSVDGAIHFVCMDWRHITEVMAAADGAYTEFKNLCVWTKTNGGMGSLYRSQHELVFVFKVGKAPHINNVELGRHGRNRTNVWQYAGVNTFGDERDENLKLHPTVKPVALVADAIRDCSVRNGIVLDVFAGSGSSLVAAAKTGRRGHGLELDPAYVDVIIRRLQAETGLAAVLVGTGATFNQVETARRTTNVETTEAAE